MFQRERELKQSESEDVRALQAIETALGVREATDYKFSIVCELRDNVDIPTHLQKQIPRRDWVKFDFEVVEGNKTAVRIHFSNDHQNWIPFGTGVIERSQGWNRLPSESPLVRSFQRDHTLGEEPDNQNSSLTNLASGLSSEGIVEINIPTNTALNVEARFEIDINSIRSYLVVIVKAFADSSNSQ